jgi:hypothetical protein
VKYSEKIQEFKDNRASKKRFKENKKFSKKLHEFKNPDPFYSTVIPKSYNHTLSTSGSFYLQAGKK